MSAMKRNDLKRKQQVKGVFGKSAKLEKEIRPSGKRPRGRRHSVDLSSCYSEPLESFSLDDDSSIEMEGGGNLLNSVATK